MGPPDTVVDTGFWNTCCRLGIHVYLTHIRPDPVLIPGAVIAEIFHQPAFMTTLNAASWASWGPLYRDQADFLNAFLQRTLQPSNPNLSRVALFHPSERAVLDLSQQVSANALIDEQKAHDYAITQGSRLLRGKCRQRLRYVEAQGTQRKTPHGPKRLPPA